MQYKILERDPSQIVGIKVRTSNEQGKGENDIPLLWHRFHEENVYGNIPFQKTGEVVGLYCEYQKDQTGPYTFIVGCEVTLASDLPQDFVLKHLPAAKYAVFQVEGKFPESLVQTWQWIWNSNLKRTFMYDLEIYPLGFDQETNPEMLLYIGIK